VVVRAFEVREHLPAVGGGEETIISAQQDNQLRANGPQLYRQLEFMVDGLPET